MKVKAVAYKTVVRPQLDYALSVWAPHTQCNIELQDRQWKTGVDQVTSQQYLEQHIPLWEETHHIWYST